MVGRVVLGGLLAQVLLPSLVDRVGDLQQVHAGDQRCRNHRRRQRPCISWALQVLRDVLAKRLDSLCKLLLVFMLAVELENMSVHLGRVAFEPRPPREAYRGHRLALASLRRCKVSHQRAQEFFE